MPGSFFDTNVLLYIAAVDPAKADRAEELIGRRRRHDQRAATEGDRQCCASQDGHVMGGDARVSFYNTRVVAGAAPYHRHSRDRTGARGALQTVDLGCHDRRAAVFGGRKLRAGS